MQTDKNSGLNYLEVKNNSHTAIILLHGYGASMDDLFGLHEVIETPGPADWFFPDAPLAVDIGYMMQGRAWFPIDMQELEKAMMSGTHRVFADKCPKEFLTSLKVLEQFVLNISSQYQNVILGGFSQGAMLASHLGAKLKQIKALILFSSTLLAKDNLSESITNIDFKRPFFQSHGTNDPLLSFAQAQDLFEFLNLNGLVGEFTSFQGGHEIPMPVIRNLNNWIKQLDWE